MSKRKRPAGRICFLDEARGFDILLMIAYHAFYTAGWVLNLQTGKDLFRFFAPVEPFFAGVFIFICGVCCRLSRNNFKRGGLLALVAAGISLALWFFMPDNMIWFGVLHMLAVGILLFALLRPLLDKLPPWLGLALAVVLGVITWHVPGYNGALFGVPGIWSVPIPEWMRLNPWLYPLGLGQGTLHGTDYFPLLPWLFVFLAGCYVGVWAKAGKFPRWMSRSHVPFLAAIGRHSLIIYVVHQPVIYGVGWLILQVIGRING
ncbi:MAG: heparan-alpha-glucosaminide N-acetyltransferase [Acutalibacteraceae bacterium]